MSFMILLIWLKLLNLQYYISEIPKSLRLPSTNWLVDRKEILLKMPLKVAERFSWEQIRLGILVSDIYIFWKGEEGESAENGPINIWQGRGTCVVTAKSFLPRPKSPTPHLPFGHISWYYRAHWFYLPRKTDPVLQTARGYTLSTWFFLNRNKTRDTILRLFPSKGTS